MEHESNQSKIKQNPVPPPTPSGFGGTFLTQSQREALERTATALATPGKGITACDESAGTLGARFEHVGIENTEENRRQYRQMLFTAVGSEAFLCGAILDPETLYQRSDADTSFPEVLAGRGIVPGVKPHLKVYKLPGCGGDTVMQGLDSLADRCREYYKAGARFAKWRSPLSIDVGAGRPTPLAVKACASDLARYALICQSEGLCPIVEPDIGLSGDHDLATAVAINVRVQSELFRSMLDHGVYMPGAMLKPNMVNPGRDCRTRYTCEEIASANVHVLEQSFPVAMKGANYLSGGQSLSVAAARLAAINRRSVRGPWNLSFSWSQAIQLPVLDLCRQKGGGLHLVEMSELYVKNLSVAAAAAAGTYGGDSVDGDHVGSNTSDPVDISKKRRRNDSVTRMSHDNSMKIPLHDAVRRNDVANIQSILSHAPATNIDINAEDEEGITALIEACIRGNEPIVVLLLENGCPAQPAAGFRHSPLCRASVCGHAHLIPLLLKFGADPNSLSDGNRTPLMGACFLRKGVDAGRSVACVRALLDDERTDPTVSDLGAETALDLAKVRGYKESIFLLQQALDRRKK